MKIVVIGASGTIGSSVVNILEGSNEIIRASRNGDVQMDLSDSNSILNMYKSISDIDAVICAAGEANFGPLDSFTDKDFEFSFGNKLMGQINLVRFGRQYLNKRGVITLTTGILAHSPSPATVMLTTINRALEAFVEAASQDMPNNIRLNSVCPPMAKETAEKLGWGPGGMPANQIATYYEESLNIKFNGVHFGPTH